MDRPDCDQNKLFNTYQQFSRINHLLSGWQKNYANYIRPVIKNNNGKASILDIGCGGGDIIRMMYHWTQKDGFDVQLTGIDPDRRSLDYLSGLNWPDSVDFKPVYSRQLVSENRHFDIVISNHLMHHLKETELKEICLDADRLAVRVVLFSDIERSDLGYLFFSAIAPLLFRNSYIVHDGRISIKRSFRKQELRKQLPDNWIVQRQFPFRLLAIHQKCKVDG